MGPSYSTGSSGYGDCTAKSAFDCSKSRETGTCHTLLIFMQEVSLTNWIYCAWKSFNIAHNTDSQFWAFWIIKRGVIGIQGVSQCDPKLPSVIKLWVYDSIA